MNELTEKEWNLQVAESKGMGVEDYINPTEQQVNSKLESKKEAVNRKETPVFSGVLQYFPDAIKAVARCSFVGNDQHNPNKPLHWDRSKSGDELDAMTRHLLDAGTLDTDGIRHSTKVAWRALANLQKEIENENK
tara:strand:- start:30 stop:434 length:405 start_codon:yes stop_codon:yes gene_type:complete